MEDPFGHIFIFLNDGDHDYLKVPYHVRSIKPRAYTIVFQGLDPYGCDIPEEIRPDAAGECVRPRLMWGPVSSCIVVSEALFDVLI